MEEENGMEYIESENPVRLSDKAFKAFVEALNEPAPQTAVDLLKRDPEWL